MYKNMNSRKTCSQEDSLRSIRPTLSVSQALKATT